MNLLPDNLLPENLLPDKRNLRIEREDFDDLFTALKQRGYSLVGPTLRNGAILYDALNLVDDLPIGWTDVQEAASYRIKRRDDKALFGYNVGPHSWKQFLFPPRKLLWRGKKTEDAEDVENQSFETVVKWVDKSVDNSADNNQDITRYAFIGVRACELHAIHIQDNVFMGGVQQNSDYAGRREDNFIVAVNCGQAANTCFCTSMNTGPKVGAGYDLALTEIIDGETHYFVAQAGSEKGTAVLSDITSRSATSIDLDNAAACTEKAKAEMGRHIDISDIKELLYRNYDNAQWEQLEKRCLACGNCTMACPTCFCSKVDDVTDLTGEYAERWSTWDSCFSMDFSYIHGGSVRASTKSRYRQWLTHKLATWLDQFGSSGCVGCGRCITWCPVGIDLTAEVNAIRDSDVEVVIKSTIENKN